MYSIFRCGFWTCIIGITALNLILVVYGTGCEFRDGNVSIIGVAGHNIIDTRSLEGFKAGMKDLGYIEGKNIKYIYEYIPELTEHAIDVKIKSLP